MNTLTTVSALFALSVICNIMFLIIIVRFEKLVDKAVEAKIEEHKENGYLKRRLEETESRLQELNNPYKVVVPEEVVLPIKTIHSVKHLPRYDIEALTKSLNEEECISTLKEDLLWCMRKELKDYITIKIEDSFYEPNKVSIYAELNVTKKV